MPIKWIEHKHKEQTESIQQTNVGDATNNIIVL